MYQPIPTTNSAIMPTSYAPSYTANDGLLRSFYNLYIRPLSPIAVLVSSSIATVALLFIMISFLKHQSSPYSWNEESFVLPSVVELKYDYCEASKPTRSSYTPPTNSKLIQIQLITRHGDRARLIQLTVILSHMTGAKKQNIFNQILTNAP